MGLGGAVDSRTWHHRMGHPSAQKMVRMIKRGIIPKTVNPNEASQCTVCKTTKPRRRPVPTVAERSELATVQVDYMPMGRDELGWKGEMGAYIFSGRTSKIVKAYPVTGTSTEAGILALEHYLIYIASSLTHKIECIQTDAGRQFVTGEWGSTCHECCVGLRSLVTT